MSTSLSNEQIPYGYAHCFATPEACPKQAECLHALIAHLPYKPKKEDMPVIVAIDPRYIAAHAGEGRCSQFRSSKPVSYARGMTRMYDEVPGKVLHEVKRRVEACFSCRNYYFTSRKGERLISPKEQEKIANVFRRCCPNLQPVYDSMVEAFSWE